MTLEANTWTPVATQPVKSMRWEWLVPLSDFRRGVDSGTVASVTKRDGDRFVLLAKLAVKR